MPDFLNDNFLLGNDIARTLFHDHAKAQPIIDYHCHIDPREIAQDRRFDNITQVWLGGDHYKWRLMRSAGVEECYITGDAPDREKFLKWAAVLGRAIGNPLYHWSHLELRRYFDYDGCLCADTADEVWELCNARLQQADMSARGIISRSNVEVVCTTDDPIDSLEWHAAIAADDTFGTLVLPAWRPDNAMGIEKPGFASYLHKLEKVSGIRCDSFAALREALRLRMDHFAAHGCRLSDHGLDYVPYLPASDDEIECIFANVLSGGSPDEEQILKYKTSFLRFVGTEYARRGWVMQLHYGCLRNNNPAMFAKIGTDTGFDSISNYTPAAQLTGFLGSLEADGALPKTIIYSLNPADNAAIGTAIGCFQQGPVVSRIQHGSAWWFNDHLSGMREQMTSLASLGYLAGFVGMLTDSRSFLSYSRHEYFRRILCGMLGQWVEDGLYPRDMAALGSIVEDISYGNAKRYFNFG